MCDHYWKQREREEVERKCGCWSKGRCLKWDWINNKCDVIRYKPQPPPSCEIEKAYKEALDA